MNKFDASPEDKINAIMKILPHERFVFGKTRDDFIAYLQSIKFFEEPASRNHHGAYPGGLFDHSLLVAALLKELPYMHPEEAREEWEHENSPIIIGLLHDLCKCCRNLPEGDHKTSVMEMRHGFQSVAMIEGWMLLTYEEAECIRWHMGAFIDEAFWQDYSTACKHTPAILMTHTADMYAAQVLDV